jgi:hypothetical protein
MASLAAPNFEERLHQYRREISRQSTEAGKAYLFLEFIRAVFSTINADHVSRLYPEIERSIRYESRTLAIRGRIDAFLGNVIIEFKMQMGEPYLEQARNELKRYVATLWSLSGTVRVRFIVMATDGIHFVAFRPRTTLNLGQEVSPDQVILDQIDRLSIEDATPNQIFVWLDRYAIYRTRRVATSTTISEEFGLGKSAYEDTVNLLRAAWRESPKHTLYEQWGLYLRIVYGSSVESEGLFIRHAYLATLAKIMAYATMTGGALPVTDQEIRRILDGEVFSKDWGIHNFLEKDFFSWVGHTSNGIEATRIILDRIDNYELTAIDEDILKGLYQDLVDAEERHDLGEYYTPDWLAEHIVEQTIIDPRVSVLDPACGSGTFLSAAIRAKKERLGSEMAPSHLLESIFSTVRGIDVHPLAVLMARTTYLLSVGTELLGRRVSSVSVPVYMADSIRLPEETRENAHDIECAKVPANGKALMIPTVFTREPLLTDPAIDIASDYADMMSRDEQPGLRAFLNEMLQNNHLKEALSENGTYAQIFFELAEAIAALIRGGTDTIWGFLLKNKYKPLALSERKVELLLGNPPWLSYRYVESTDYQNFLKSAIVTEHKLLQPSDAELMTQMELGTLFFARTASLYLRRGGMIAFVLPRSIFSAAQHDSFRRQTFVPQMRITKIIDLRHVEPLFAVPACVVFAVKEE